MNPFKKKNAARLALGAVLVAFVVKMLVVIATEGAEPLSAADAPSEGNSSIGAVNFVQKGFWRGTGLPDYNIAFNLDSPSKPILESPFYAHYFPGPDYVLALTYGLFGTGRAVFQWTRLIPLAHVVLAMLFFLWAAERRVWRGNRWVAPFVALFVLFAPAMRPWAVGLHGHAYSSAYILTGLGLGLIAGERRYRFEALAAAAFAIGFVSNYMLLTGAFAVFGAPLVGGLLAAEKPGDCCGWRGGAVLAFVAGVGLAAGFGTHFAQVAAQFTAHDAWIDLTGTMGNRMAKLAYEPSRVQLLGQYSNHVYGFWGVSSLAMLLLGALAGWLHPGAKAYRRNLFLAVLVGGLASYGWIMVMKNHSIGHPHVNPRVFLVMYAAFVSVLGALAAERMGASARR
ncbi:MAG: hypothetical protein HY075_05210 [Deltaproteobacteria bacterium]|nr:hypothetical protein [Deltaproteobacteria bacterium]